ncbi:MAG: serine/threonine protein kinase [Candidatus Abyssubacteria bacterium]|nr:serine/threonine protein kinase [Candidatus Abyssubacteria bacterium]
MLLGLGFRKVLSCQPTRQLFPLSESKRKRCEQMIGKIISHYRIIEELGAGAMSTVYKAEDTVLERTVAIKILSPGLYNNLAARKRFLRGAQAAAKLDHPNICTLYEIGETGHRYFASMAFVDGQSLREKVENGPLDINEAVRIGLQIAEGLNIAHKNKIIHRDIKNANIMITKEGVVKVLDFGLAKLIEKEEITKPRAILGTLTYMSPEQAMGQRVDFRTDIWSLGAVMYKILTGERPFKARNAAGMIKAILTDTPERIRILREDVPEELEQIIEKMMERGRQLRHNNMEEVIADLRRVSSARI